MTETNNPVTTLQRELDKRVKEVDDLKGDVAKLRDQLSTTTAELARTKASLKAASLEVELIDAAVNAGVAPIAARDVAGRALAKGDWEWNSEGRLRLKESDGFPGDYFSTWLGTIREKLPHYFAGGELTEPPSSSVGSQAGSSGGAGGARAPETDPSILRDFTRETEHLTNISIMYNADPERAKAIAKQVGNPIFDRLEQQDRRFGG